MSKRIRPWHLIAGLVAFLAVVAGCSGAGQQQPAAQSQAAAGGAMAAGGAVAGDVAKGKEVFINTCAACHGANARGIPGSGKDLVNKSDWMKQQTDEALIAMIKRGRPASDPLNTTKVDMPPKGGNPALTDEDIKNVVAYIRSLQK